MTRSQRPDRWAKRPQHPGWEAAHARAPQSPEGHLCAPPDPGACLLGHAVSLTPFLCATHPWSVPLGRASMDCCGACADSTYDTDEDAIPSWPTATFFQTL